MLPVFYLANGYKQPPPPYMQDNINNYFGTAPDAGSLQGPVWYGFLLKL